MPSNPSDRPVSPLRARMIEDMTVRGFVEKTRQDYVRHVQAFAAFIGRSPATATPGDIRGFQLHQRQSGMQPPSINTAVSALRFLFTVTLDRPELARRLTVVRQPRRLPTVLSVEEVTLLLQAAPGPKYRAAFATAYGAGLRVSEVVSLQLGDIDSQRKLIRIRQGKGKKDRYAMLSARLLEVLRCWWRSRRPAGQPQKTSPQDWLFPGWRKDRHMNTATLQDVCREAARAAGLSKRITVHTLRHSFSTHLLENGTDIRIIQVLLGHSRIDTTARYARVGPQVVAATVSPLDNVDSNARKASRRS